MKPRRHISDRDGTQQITSTKGLVLAEDLRPTGVHDHAEVGTGDAVRSSPASLN